MCYERRDQQFRVTSEPAKPEPQPEPQDIVEDVAPVATLDDVVTEVPAPVLV